MKNKFIIALSLFIAVVCTVFIFVGVISGNDSLEKQTGTEENVPAHTESDGTQQPSVSDENSAENSSSSSSVNGGSDAQDTLGLKDSNINDDDNKSDSNNSSEPMFSGILWRLCRRYLILFRWSLFRLSVFRLLPAATALSTVRFIQMLKILRQVPEKNMILCRCLRMLRI